MEESKLKLQNKYQILSQPPSSSVSTNTIHQSIPNLSSPSNELPILKIDDTNSANEDDRRSTKVESNVFKIVEQSRRNSRTDRKNFGRYFTADGTSTHGTNSSPVKQISSSSTAIIKRMSWNNEKNDTSLITNSFRSVHSSSGVSSTGSFLFSADEESSITTTTSSSIPPMISSTTNKNEDLTDELDEFDGKSSSSTVVGTDDHEHLINPISSQEQNTSLHLNDINDNSQHLVNRLSTASTNTITSLNNQITNGKF